MMTAPVHDASEKDATETLPYFCDPSSSTKDITSRAGTPRTVSDRQMNGPIVATQPGDARLCQAVHTNAECQEERACASPSFKEAECPCVDLPRCASCAGPGRCNANNRKGVRFLGLCLLPFAVPVCRATLRNARIVYNGKGAGTHNPHVRRYACY